MITKQLAIAIVVSSFLHLGIFYGFRGMSTDLAGVSAFPSRMTLRIAPMVKGVVKAMVKRDDVTQNYEKLQVNNSKKVQTPKAKAEQRQESISDTSSPSVHDNHEVSPVRSSGDIEEKSGSAERVQYIQLLAEALSRVKQYPERAERLGLEGKNSIALRIDSSGVLEDVVLEESSGSTLFDREALRMAHAATPYPVPPSEIGPFPVHIKIPIRFQLNRERG
ncbi:MAG: energy transducer TonB [Bdellovibrionales bacterium]|nr:energy transducer TonB [Bdellovibrionales bacterium]